MQFHLPWLRCMLHREDQLFKINQKTKKVLQRLEGGVIQGENSLRMKFNQQWQPCECLYTTNEWTQLPTLIDSGKQQWYKMKYRVKVWRNNMLIGEGARNIQVHNAPGGSNAAAAPKPPKQTTLVLNK